MSSTCRAVAGSNIALVKYWGKRAGIDPSLNLPAVGSISLTLETLVTETEVAFLAGLPEDRFELVGEEGAAQADERARGRVSRFLDLVRERAGTQSRARVRSHNRFPTGAGLASSASGFAALALAATRAAGLELSPPELAALARQGSGSAARSVFGGFVELEAGVRRDGTDCLVRSLAEPAHWPLSVVVGITSARAKTVGSREGMEHTAATSPYHDAWIASHPRDLEEARAAVATRDFERLARVTERSCLKMHASALAADPGILYWNPATIAALGAVRELRRSGLAVCFTIDAGPQVKAVCEPSTAQTVRDRLAATPGVERVLVASLGPGARIVDPAAPPAGPSARPTAGTRAGKTR